MNKVSLVSNRILKVIFVVFILVGVIISVYLFIDMYPRKSDYNSNFGYSCEHVDYKGGSLKFGYLDDQVYKDYDSGNYHLNKNSSPDLLIKGVCASRYWQGKNYINERGNELLASDIESFKELNNFLDNRETSLFINKFIYLKDNDWIYKAYLSDDYSNYSIVMTKQGYDGSLGLAFLNFFISLLVTFILAITIRYLYYYIGFGKHKYLLNELKKYSK